jgi:hypothetical protein
MTAHMVDLKVRLERGPCLDASATSAPVLIHDLRDCAPATGRAWAMFRGEALRVGVSAILRLPPVFASVPVGCLGLYCGRPALSQVQLSRGLSAAQELSETLVDSASLPDEPDCCTGPRACDGASELAASTKPAVAFRGSERPSRTASFVGRGTRGGGIVGWRASRLGSQRSQEVRQS